MTQGFSGVGLVKIHQRTNGLKGLGREVGNCPSLKITMQPDTVERNESLTTARAPLRRMTRQTKADIELVTDEFNKANFALAALARVDEVAADAATLLTYTAPTGAVVGNVISVPDGNINTVSVVDSTGSPVTVPPANYIVDTFSGDVKLLDITTGGPYVQPFKVKYKKGAISVISGLAVPAPEIWLSMSGTNADDGQRGDLDVFRVRLDPAQVLEFIKNDYADFTITGTALYDPLRQNTDVGGNIFQFAIPATHE